MGAIRRSLGWLRRNKSKTLLGLLGLIVLAYGIVFLFVERAQSPTNLEISLNDGRKVAWLRWPGSGPAGNRVILVHGAPTDASCWTKLARHVSGLPVGEWIVIDRFGYGNSTRGAVLQLAEHAKAVRPFLREGENARNIVVGHSYGGPVALRAAAEYPERVDGVVLVAGACDPYMKDAIRFRRFVNGIAWVVPTPWEVANRELLALTGENRKMEPLLNRVRCPVFVIHGRWDPVCPFEGTVDYLKKSLVNAESVDVVALEKAGHNLHLSHPEVLARAIHDLLTKKAPGNTANGNE